MIRIGKRLSPYMPTTERTVRAMNETADCNYCYYLNITEFEQDRLKSNGIRKNHICLKYGKRVFHNANTKNHSSRLYPCSECVADIDRKEKRNYSEP